MSSRVGDGWRRYAASERAAWSITTSARWPRTSASTQIEEIDLVDVEDVAIGFRKNARLEAPHAGAQGRLDVDGADDPVLRRVDRKLDDPHPALVMRESPGGLELGAAIGAKQLEVCRVAS